MKKETKKEIIYMLISILFGIVFLGIRFTTDSDLLDLLFTFFSIPYLILFLAANGRIAKYAIKYPWINILFFISCITLIGVLSSPPLVNYFFVFNIGLIISELSICIREKYKEDEKEGKDNAFIKILLTIILVILISSPVLLLLF